MLQEYDSNFLFYNLRFLIAFVNYIVFIISISDSTGIVLNCTNCTKFLFSIISLSQTYIIHNYFSFNYIRLLTASIFYCLRKLKYPSSLFQC